MRDSVKQSLADSPAKNFELYPAGSVVLCNACAKPIFKLDKNISVGDKAGRMASAFKPLSQGDLATLGRREDIDAGVRAMVSAWTHDETVAHVQKLRELRSGDPMICPCCGQCFVQVLAVDRHEVMDRAYTIELVVIPPSGHKAVAVRGRRLGTDHDWLHEHSRLVH